MGPNRLRKPRWYGSHHPQQHHAQDPWSLAVSLGWHLVDRVLTCAKTPLCVIPRMGHWMCLFLLSFTQSEKNLREHFVTPQWITGTFGVGWGGALRDPFFLRRKYCKLLVSWYYLVYLQVQYTNWAGGKQTSNLMHSISLNSTSVQHDSILHLEASSTSQNNVFLY